MPLRLYAVIEGTPARWDGRLVRAAGFTLAALDVPRASSSSSSPDAKSLTEHDARVRLLAEGAQALLPFRFGTTVESVRQAASYLAPLADEVREALERVRGRDQFALRLIAQTDAAWKRASVEPAPGPRRPKQRSGAAFLRARAQEARARQEAPELARARTAVSAWVRAERLERHPALPPLVATAYHLVDRGDVDAYLRAVKSAVPRRGPYRVAVVGPGPAYAFAPEVGG